ncbi:SEFIR domain-containing protein [Prevotella sp.]
MNPKVFISYSWHPEENKVRVQRLAERLMGDGVNVILDV